MSFDLAFVEQVGGSDPYTPVVATFGAVSAFNWPNADTGQAWTTSGGAEITSSGGKGLMSLASVGASRTARLTTPGTDQTIYADVTLPVVPSGGTITMRLGGRITDLSNFYEGWVEVAPSGAATVRLRKTVASVSTFLSSAVAAGTHSAGDSWTIGLRVNGSSLMAKAWKKATSAEPDWQTATTDTDITTGAGAGCLGRLETGNTNTLPVVLSWDNFLVTSPALRLDLNSTSIVTQLDGSSFGVPELRRARSSTLLADGDFISASAYGNRLLVFRVQLASDMTDKDTAALQVQRLMREVNRDRNIVRYRPGTSLPVYFRTFRSDYASVEWDGLSAFATVTVEAEPFAWGPLETLSAITFDGDPASTNGIWVDITGLKGDVETALILSGPRAFSTTPARQAVYGVRRRQGGFTMASVQQAEALNAGTDTTTQTDAAYSGGTPNCMRTAFTSTANAVRMSGFVSFPAAAESRGRYRVYARLKKSVAIDPITVQFGWGYTAPATVLNTAVVLPATTNVVIVDLGDMSVPFGPDPVFDGASGVELPVNGGGFIELYASRASGTSNLDVDFLAFIPASDQLSLISYPVYGGASGPLQVWDGVNETVWESTVTGTVRSAPAVPIEGAAALMVSPGVTNRIWALRDVTPGAATDLSDVTYGASYYPRYLFVRSVGS